MTVKKFLADQIENSTKDMESLRRKISYYQDFLNVMGKVDPGFTTWRGQVLFELHKPLLIEANSMHELGNLTTPEFVCELRKIASFLEESVKCLQFEPDGTKPAHQAKWAIKALKEVKEIIFFSDFL